MCKVVCRSAGVLADVIKYRCAPQIVSAEALKTFPVVVFTTIKCTVANMIWTQVLNKKCEQEYLSENKPTFPRLIGAQRRVASKMLPRERRSASPLR